MTEVRLRFISITALLLAAQLGTLPTPARADQTQVYPNDKQCSDDVCVGLSCTGNIGNLSASAVDGIQIQPTHFNVRTPCLKETQAEVGLGWGNLNVLLARNCNTFSVQACRRFKTDFITSGSSKCGGWNAFRVQGCPKPTPPPAPPPEETCGPAQYGTEGCPFPPFSNAPGEDLEQLGNCQAYARTAVKAVAANRDWKCGNTGDRWTENFKAHFDWCMSLGKDPRGAESESQARSEALAACKEAAKSKAEVEQNPEGSVGKILEETQPPNPEDKAGVTEKPGKGIGDILKETQP